MCSYKCTEIIITALIIAININIISSVATWRATKVNLSLFSFILLWWMPIWCLKLEQSPCDYEKRSRAWYSSRNVDTVFIGPLDHAIGIFILFIYLWPCWALVAAWLSSGCGERGSSLAVGCLLLTAVACLVVEQGTRRVGFSPCGSWALEHRLRSCGSQA